MRMKTDACPPPLGVSFLLSCSCPAVRLTEMFFSFFSLIVTSCSARHIQRERGGESGDESAPQKKARKTVIAYVSSLVYSSNRKGFARPLSPSLSVDLDPSVDQQIAQTKRTKEGRKGSSKGDRTRQSVPFLSFFLSFFSFFRHRPVSHSANTRGERR
mmetsp:Transcript_3826/g.7880  ORF Transcript_3826/g.7880 Transcript_3826/m.7880 type:complete len:158 (+) Transcript_3826:3057-3530(+)